MVFSISNNSCLVEAASQSPLQQSHIPPRLSLRFFPFFFSPLFFISPWSRRASERILFAALAARVSAGCRGVVYPGFFFFFSSDFVVPAETMRVRFHNIEQSFISGFERRDARGEGKQNVRQLLNVAGVVHRARAGGFCRCGY